MSVPARTRVALALALVAAVGAAGCTDAGERPGDDITDTLPVPGFVLDPAGASISPDTSRIAVPCHDRICVWGIGGDLEDEVEGSTGTSWLGDRLVVGGARELVVDPAGEAIKVPVPGQVRGLRGAEDGSAVAVLLDDEVVVVRAGAAGDLESGDVTWLDAPGVVDVALSPDAARVVAAVDGAPPRVIDVDSTDVVGTLGEEPAARVAWSPDGAAIAAGGPGGAALFAAGSLEPQAELGEPAVADLDFGASAETVGIADADDGVLVLWEPATGDATEIGRHSAPSGRVLWSRGDSLYSVAPDVVLAWSTETGTVASTFELPPFE